MTWILAQGVRYELDSQVTEFGFLDPNLVIRKLRMSESRELFRRPQLRQMHGGYIPSQVRNSRERSDGFLYIEMLRESTAREGYKS